MKDIIYLLIIAAVTITAVIITLKKQEDNNSVLRPVPIYRPIPDFTLWPEDGPDAPSK